MRTRLFTRIGANLHDDDPHHQSERRGPRDPREPSQGPRDGKRQRCRETQPRGELIVSGQHRRRDHADDNRAERAARRDVEVERRQLVRRRPATIELGVEKDADEEERSAKHRRRSKNRRVQNSRVQEIACRPESDHGEREHEPLRTPTLAAERDDEAQQIRDERRNPQQRNRRDVLADVIRDGGEEQRPARSERDPEDAVSGTVLARFRRFDRRLDRVGGLARTTFAASTA